PALTFAADQAFGQGAGPIAGRIIAAFRPFLECLPFPPQRLNRTPHEQIRPFLREADCRGAISGPELAVGAHPSHTPNTIQRAGEFLCPTNCRAPAPSFDRITRLSGPAPRLSIASSGSPSSLPSGVIGWTSSKRQPVRLACLTVETA